MMNQPPVDGPVGPGVDRVLSSAMDLYGPAVLREPARLRLYLQTQCPAAAREIGAVMAALGEGVPQAMLAAHSEEDIDVLLPLLIDRLAAKLPIKGAEWAVRAWAHALAMSTRALDAPPTAVARATTAVTSQRSNAAEVLGIGRGSERVAPQVPKVMSPVSSPVVVPAPLMPESSSLQQPASTPEPMLMPELASTHQPIEIPAPIVISEPIVTRETVVASPVEPAPEVESASIEDALIED
jgi:hypothetical protein